MPMMPAPTTISFCGTLAKFERAGRRHDALLVDLDAGKPRDIGAGGDDDVLRLQRLRLAVVGFHLDLAGRDDAAGAAKGFDLVFLEQKVDALDVALDVPVLVFEQRRQIDARRADLDAHLAERVPGLLIKLRGVQHRLRGNAADVEAGAAEGRVLLDDGGLHPKLRGADGADVAAGPVPMTMRS